MKVYLAFLDKLNQLVYYIGAVMLGVMVTSTFVQVLTRYIFHYSLPWTNDLAKYLFIWATMLGAGILVYHAGHISVTFVARAFPRRLSYGAYLFSSLCVILCAVLLTFTGYSFALANVQNFSVSLGISYALPMASICVGGALMVLFGVGCVAKSKADWKEGQA